ncbi:uncharacterized protein BJ171DRAFT_486484 [Polychytrium aggregatum]|uniref:uncharacterized protein n=1 Tax=Polychytrium aggregatum TaxID=110093 RepID=UPI0022FEE383|nr:uncharacterized protein BJ171DRAFT_486484 [Polychytrium aggregatum]KAI9209334.1 hypothetical protein BJ171DRAFT_486484 [Polychytrium aggregatum]
MNSEGAQDSLDRSRKAYRDGDLDNALKFARKSLKLHATQEAQDWLDKLTQSSQNDGSSPGSSSGLNSEPSSSNLRNRTNATSASAADSPSASRSFTKEQESGIRRIKETKSKGDLYGVLGLTKDCTDSEIKKAYRKLALQFHPDKCSAPGTDEAFKAISHAFTVLSDPEKRARFDNYGVDSDSRGAEASPFGGNHGFQEVSPEEIFNMFFRDMAGGPAFRTATFSAGGPGFRAQFHNNPFQQRPMQQDNSSNGNGLHIIQFLPLLLILFFSLFSWGSHQEPAFAFSQSSRYSMSRETARHNVQYWVEPTNFERRYGNSPSRLRQLEGDVEVYYARNLQQRCAYQREIQYNKMMQARTWFSVDQKKLSEAQNMKLEACEKLARFQRA